MGVDMPVSLLNNFFQDVNNWLASNLGSVGIIILLVMFSVLALFLLSNIIVAATKLKKPKLVIKWGQLIFLIILVVAIVWLAMTYPTTIY